MLRNRVWRSKAEARRPPASAKRVIRDWNSESLLTYLPKCQSRKRTVKITLSWRIKKKCKIGFCDFCSLAELRNEFVRDAKIVKINFHFWRFVNFCCENGTIHVKILKNLTFEINAAIRARICGQESGIKSRLWNWKKITV